MNVDVDGLRAAAEAATAEMDRLTSAPGGPGQAWRWSIPANPERDSDLIFDEVIRHVPALLDRLQAAEAAVAAAALNGVAVGWTYAHDKVCPQREFCSAHQPITAKAQESVLSALGTQAALAALEIPQEATGADLSASGAESDHGDRREGEGLA